MIRGLVRNGTICEMQLSRRQVNRLAIERRPDSDESKFPNPRLQPEDPWSPSACVQRASAAIHRNRLLKDRRLRAVSAATRWDQYRRTSHGGLLRQTGTCDQAHVAVPIIETFIKPPMPRDCPNKYQMRERRKPSQWSLADRNRVPSSLGDDRTTPARYPRGNPCPALLPDILPA